MTWAAWGDSWGDSWGGSWGYSIDPAPPLARPRRVLGLGLGLGLSFRQMRTWRQP